MSYWINLVEPDRKHRGIENFGVHCSWNYRNMMEHLPCGWVRDWQGKQASDMYQVLKDSYCKLINSKELYEKYEIDPVRNLGTINNCIDILQKCYIGFLQYPDGIITID